MGGENTETQTVAEPLAPSMTVRLDSGETPPANPKKAFGDRKRAVHLVPPILVLETAPAMAEGAEKYGPFNWRQSPVEVMTYVGAIGRHLAAFADGEDVDPESTKGKTHLAGIAACVAILMDARALGNLIDNRPPRGPAPEVARDPGGSAVMR